MKSKMQTAWKVVEAKNGEFRSCVWLNYLTYTNRRWTLPRPDENPFLFVMCTRRQARAYINGILADRKPRQKFRIFKCKVRNLTDDRYVEHPNGNYRMGRFNMPDGTRYADAVKLI